MIIIQSLVLPTMLQDHIPHGDYLRAGNVGDMRIIWYELKVACMYWLH